MNFQAAASALKSAMNKIAEKFFDNRCFSYLLILAVVIILYHPSFERYFVGDDFPLIEKAKNNFSFYNAFVVQFFKGQFYRPVTREILYAISYDLFKLNPIGYRIISFVFFIACCFLVYEITNGLTKRRDVAFVTSIVFASRDAHSIALYWIAAGFQETGMAFFVLCAIYLYLQSVRYENKLFYLSSLTCSILALMSKETSVVLPLLILSLEVYTQKQKNDFDLKVLMRRVIPFCVVTLIYMSRLYFFTRIPRGLVIQGYRIKFSLTVLQDNIAYYIRNSFNTPLEFVLFFYVIFLAFLKGGDRKYTFFSLGWFFSGMLPFIFLEAHSFLYYLMVSLVGFSLFISIGIKDLHDRFYQMRYVLVPILLFFLIISAHTNTEFKKNLSPFNDPERIACNILSYLKQSFPYLHDGSLIYIKKADDLMWWALGRGSAIRVNYNNNISVYFEGVTKKLPSHYGKVYYFYYDNENIHFLNESTELVIVKP